jgi:FdrA protein
MINGFVKPNCFQDSVSLMLISKKLSDLETVNLVSVMMGTPANKDLFQSTGMWHELFDTATPNDVCIAVDTDGDADDAMEEVTTQLDIELANISSGSKRKSLPTVRSWTRALKVMPDANLALISVAGEYAAATAQRALDEDLNVMMFSDNVPIEQELALKQNAAKKGLIVMGPDCGTAYISGTPLAFANQVSKGKIGIVGASGTGIQEICSQVDLLGGGITHAIGLGGRDLSEQIGGISAKMALEMLDNDPETKVIAFVSKPPAASVREDILASMQKLKKPVVALFLGDRPEVAKIGNVRLCYTLDEVAKTAQQLTEVLESLDELGGLPLSSQKILGLYTGGTLAAECAMLLADHYKLPVSASHPNGEMLNSDGHLVIDLGDDAYTVGRPHPMIDPSTRTDQLQALKDHDFGVLLMDVVLGFGSHEDPAQAVVDGVKELREARSKPFAAIVTVTGTNTDPQNRNDQIAKLKEAGIKVINSVPEAIEFSSLILETSPLPANSDKPHYLLDHPTIINIGLSTFAEDLFHCEADAIHYRWAPIAGGNPRLAELLTKIS